MSKLFLFKKINLLNSQVIRQVFLVCRAAYEWASIESRSRMSEVNFSDEVRFLAYFI